MMDVGFVLIFWYGMLHAFGPDHLTVIADFSIGKSMKKTLFITFMFAFGHGLMLFFFAKLLEFELLPASITAYGDMISSAVIISMGMYLLFMVAAKRIHLNKHYHDGKEHLHIYFGKEHSHKVSTAASAWTMGALMGAGGVRGMLVTLGMLHGGAVEWTMILVFIAGVSLIFVSFGAIILYFNQLLLRSIENIRMTFAFAGLVSVGVGSHMLLS